MTNSKRLAHLITGSGPRVVVVHGFTQSKASWEFIAPQLGRSHEVIAIDLPDHSGSTDVHASDLDDAAALVGEVGGTSTYIGYSLGGRVCLTLALRSPELVRRLVLIGATPGLLTEEEREARRAADNTLADRIDPPDGSSLGMGLAAFLAEWLDGPLFSHLNPEQANVAARLSNTTAGLARSLRTTGTGTQVPSHDQLSELSMPVLLVAGANDVRFSAIARAMAAAIGANASVAIVDGVGHAVPFEAPLAFCDVVEEFLARTDEGSAERIASTSKSDTDRQQN